MFRAGPGLPPQPARRDLDQRHSVLERVTEVARGDLRPALAHAPGHLGEQARVRARTRGAGGGQLASVHPGPAPRQGPGSLDQHRLVQGAQGQAVSR